MKQSLRVKIIAATPLFCLFVFLVLGFADDFGFAEKPLWHPGWIIFLLIPIMPILLGIKRISLGYPSLCLIVYLIIGFAFKMWHPGWIIFLTVPIVSIFFHKPIIEINKKNKEE